MGRPGEPLRFLATTADPGFATDPEGTIVAWNAAAEQLFGRSASETVGERCYKLFRARDVFGNRYCCPNCPLQRMASRGEPMRHCTLRFPIDTGRWISLAVSLIVVERESPDQFFLVHLLEPLAAADEACASRSCSVTQLSARESEVLALLDGGATTAEIGDRLCISTATVKNHVHSILDKLGVHSRLEAVSLARREGMIRTPD